MLDPCGKISNTAKKTPPMKRCMLLPSWPMRMNSFLVYLKDTTQVSPLDRHHFEFHTRTNAIYYALIRNRVEFKFTVICCKLVEKVTWDILYLRCRRERRSGLWWSETAYRNRQGSDSTATDSGAR